MDKLDWIKQDSQTKLNSLYKCLHEKEEVLAKKECELAELNEELQLAKKNETQLHSKIATREKQKQQAIDQMQDKKNATEQARITTQEWEEEAHCKAATEAECTATAEQQAKAVQETLSTDPLCFAWVLTVEIWGKVSQKPREWGPMLLQHSKPQVNMFLLWCVPLKN